MMKRTDLVKRVKNMAKTAGVPFELMREGGKHTIYSLDGNVLPIPRHNEINELTANGILKQADGITSPSEAEQDSKPESS